MSEKVIGVARAPWAVGKWEVRLACGHSKWITQISRPKRRSYDCDECRRPARGVVDHGTQA